MKLRLEDNTLRLRLSEADVEQFSSTGHVAASVPLAPGPAGQFSYALQQTPDDSTAADQTLRVAYSPGALTVLVPASLVPGWLRPEEVTLTATTEFSAGQSLRIIVEKDLGCRH